MTYTEEQVVAIVLEVVRRLEGLAGTSGARLCAGGVATCRCGGFAGEGRERAAAPRAMEDASGAELVLTERVISQRLVAGRLEGVARVVVRPRAVVTPLVRDELKRRGIELVRRGVS